ncbi:MAG TPA: hypothetical protein VGH28_03305 [Polyangiaceae bacterium]|jgi:hypothetical protein
MRSNEVIAIVACSSPPQRDDVAPDSAAPPSELQHVVIDFDELAAWTPVSTQYAQWVTFTTDSGSECDADVYAQEDGSSAPNYLACGNYPDFQANIDLKFTAPAQNLELTAVGINSDGAPGTISIFQNGSSTPVDE